jgi:hypothetical protein
MLGLTPGSGGQVEDSHAGPDLESIDYGDRCRVLDSEVVRDVARGEFECACHSPDRSRSNRFPISETTRSMSFTGRGRDEGVNIVRTPDARQRQNQPTWEFQAKVGIGCLDDPAQYRIGHPRRVRTNLLDQIDPDAHSHRIRNVAGGDFKSGDTENVNQGRLDLFERPTGTGGQESVEATQSPQRSVNKCPGSGGLGRLEVIEAGAEHDI